MVVTSEVLWPGSVLMTVRKGKTVSLRECVGWPVRDSCTIVHRRDMLVERQTSIEHDSQHLHTVSVCNQPVPPRPTNNEKWVPAKVWSCSVAGKQRQIVHCHYGCTCGMAGKLWDSSL